MTRYLARKTGKDGVTRMEEVTKKEWHEIMAENAGKPDAQRRKFFPDMILDDGDMDCLVMETPLPILSAWNTISQAARRNRKAQRRFEVVSMDNVLDEQSGLTYKDTLSNDSNFEEYVEGAWFIEELRKVIVQWKFWGPVLLDFYLAGRRRECTHEFAQMLGVSDQTARAYKRDFENFVIQYAVKHSGIQIAA